MLEQQRVTVRRISVDERLAEDAIRLEICKLEKYDEQGEFEDTPDAWRDLTGAGEDLIVHPGTLEGGSKHRSYMEVMGVPAAELENYPWKELKEGQVFLSGEFEAREEGAGENKVTRYFISEGAQNFLQIDEEVGARTKILYHEVLAREVKHG